MKFYAVANGDGTAFYSFGHKTPADAKEFLEFSLQFHTDAHIVEYELETLDEKIQRLSKELEQTQQERDRYWKWIVEMGCETCSGDCGQCDGTSGWVWSGENQEARDEHG